MALDDVWLLTKIIGAVAPLLLLLFLGYAVYRTGSGFVVLARVWRLVAGRRPIKDPTIALYVDEQHDLNSFTFMSGLRPKTIAQSLKAIEWGRQHEIDLRHAARCGHYFDVEHLRMKEDKLPSQRKARNILIVLAILYVLCGIVLVWGASTENVYMTFNDDGRAFTLTQDEAKAFAGTQPLNLQVCSQAANEVIARSGFSKTQANTLCEFFASDSRRVEYAKRLTEQRLGLLWIAFVLAFPFMMTLMWLVTVKNAYALGELIKSKLDKELPKTSSVNALTTAPQEP